MSNETRPEDMNELPPLVRHAWVGERVRSGCEPITQPSGPPESDLNLRDALKQIASKCWEQETAFAGEVYDLADKALKNYQIGLGRVPVEEKDYTKISKPIPTPDIAPGEDCPSCGHWVYGDKCEHCGKVLAQSSLEKGGFIKVTDVTTRPEPLAPTASKVEGKSLGQIAHQTYQAYRGDSLRWDQIHEDVKRAWERAGQAVADHAIEELLKNQGHLLEYEVSVLEVKVSDLTRERDEAQADAERLAKAVEEVLFHGWGLSGTTKDQLEEAIRLHNQGKGE